MTREEKVNSLEWYCDHCGDTCDKCELKNMYDKKTDEFVNNYTCAFNEMDDKMLDKIYSWYKDIDQVSCENAEAECCNKEPDDLKPNIEPKETIDVLKEIFHVDVHFVDEDCDENEEDE